MFKFRCPKCDKKFFSSKQESGNEDTKYKWHNLIRADTYCPFCQAKLRFTKGKKVWNLIWFGFFAPCWIYIFLVGWPSGLGFDASLFLIVTLIYLFMSIMFSKYEISD